MDNRFDAARTFVYTNARVLERRLFATLFEGAPASGVTRALLAYQNDDGGFGHGLEPDKRCPASLPLDVEIALHALDAAGVSAPEIVGAACDYLASVADPEGAVPLTLPVIEGYPRAAHMTDWTYRPYLNPTAGLVGLVRRLGVDHEWVRRASAYCWSALEQGLPDEAHGLGEVLLFLEQAGDDPRAGVIVPALPASLAKVSPFRSDPDDPGYGVTPLHYAPTPDSRWRYLFDDTVIQGHLDRLERDQQPDGGWALTWEPPGPAATLEYRGMETVRALRVLRAYGRLGEEAQP